MTGVQTCALPIWPISPTLYKNYSLRIAAMAFADDTAWISSSKSGLDNIITITNQFFTLNDVQINGTKSELLVINSQLPVEDRFITMGSDNARVDAISRHETIRYLGIWFSPCNSYKHQIDIVKKEINTITTAMRSKQLTVDQVVYINNRVLIPRLEYRLSTTLLPPNKAKSLFTPMTKIAKQAMRLPCTAHTNIVIHAGIT